MVSRGTAGRSIADLRADACLAVECWSDPKSALPVRNTRDVGVFTRSPFLEPIDLTERVSQRLVQAAYYDRHSCRD